MTIDKNVLKKMIDTAKPNDLFVTSSNVLDKDSHRKIRSELEKFISKGDCYIVVFFK